MTESPFVMRFDPQTIKHLGVRMYSTLPPALAEIVSNAYDADATNVTIHLSDNDGKPSQIRIEDDGIGLSSEEINDKFLIIGRNRRDKDGDKPSHKYKRLPTGKKGLGKLALFGLANTINILSRQNGKENEFVLDWDHLNSAEGHYRPQAITIDKDTDLKDGTVITLKNLKRKSPFDIQGLANSLSRIFIIDTTFNLILESSSGDRISIDNKRKYTQLNKEFEWDVEHPRLLPENSDYSGKITGELLTSKKPISPASGLRGITLFSRGKLVNAPEFFSISASSHFYQYLTGWISVDFIDLIEDDVISTNRQSINWEHPEMAKLREFLAGIVRQVNIDWRVKRKEKNKKDLKDKTGIDTEVWLKTLSGDVKDSTEQIITSLGGEDALEKYTPIIKALHDIIPEYPELHWRHLHEDLKDRIKNYYTLNQFGDAASQGVQIYCELLRTLSGSVEDGKNLVNTMFAGELPKIQLNTMNTDSEKNIQEGQGHLSRGIIAGFRNPISHGPIDSSVPGVFSELDCLNILSLVSYLITRLDNATVN